MIEAKACKECCLDQIRRLGELLNTDPGPIRAAFEKAFNANLLRTAPEYAELIFAEFEKQTGIKDPYKNIKDYSNSEAQRLEPVIHKILETKMDGLRYFIELAIIGNMIDYGAFADVEIEHFIHHAIQSPYFKFDFEEFEKDLASSKTILYIADNSGEIIFDAKLLKHLHDAGKKTYLAVRGGPIINDITKEDAVLAGVDKFATIISTNNKIPGIIMGRVSKEFKDLYYNVDMVISKGQGNFETLYTGNNKRDKLYYLFVIKCRPVAELLDAKVTDKVLMRA